jgi:hypothetical protein
LKPHQQSAVARLEAAIEELGGALLSDDVGMGKTFVATAIARRYSHILVIAPAGLASMWRDALAATETRADFLSFERLSRTGTATASHVGYDLVVVDEAHHARNPATRRYRGLMELARSARVLLLTATPIHNHRSEMVALLSVFLGSRAKALTASEVARCVVRRDRNAVAPGIAIPSVMPVSQRLIPDHPGLVEDLMSLPAPVPVRDGGDGGALIGRGLVHQWASSEAALREAVRRRIAKAAALIASLESGNYPTAHELKTWIYEDGALQLGFPQLLSSPTADAQALLESVRLHSTALEEFHARHRTDTGLDAGRAEIVLEIRASHKNAKIVAFSQYAETVSMLFGRLAATGRVAALAARGGLVAGGRLSRDEVLARFAPRASHAASPPRAEQIDLLLTTDLLSEGVNLQDAQVVVHLDVPWTAARMEQRVGRVARMGSLNPLVYVYVLRPPSSAAAVLKSELLVRRKWGDAKRAIGSSADAPFPIQVDRQAGKPDLESIPAKSERLRRILSTWRRPQPTLRFADAVTASVRASAAGFIAAVWVNGAPLLLACVAGQVSADLDSQIAACLIAEEEEMETRTEDYEVALHQIRDWFEHDLASASAGVAGSQSRARNRLLSRIDSAIQNAPPHLRTRRSQIASRARSVAMRSHGAALESDLALLAHSQLPDQQWLEAVAALDSTNPPTRQIAETGKLNIRALLLLQNDVV